MPGGKGNITRADAVPFVKGDARINRLGRPKKMNIDKLLRKVLMEHVNDEPAIKGILVKLRTMALAGNIRAAELLLDRCFGKVKVTTENQRPSVIVGIQYIIPDNGHNNKADAEATRSEPCITVE